MQILLMTLLTKKVFQDFVRVFGNNVSWKSKKQSYVSLSSTEAEYVALASAATECLYHNQPCIKICSTFKTKRSKHISVEFHFVKDVVLDRKILRLSYVETSDQLADCLNKELPYCKLVKHIEGLGISKSGER
ncbi:hypothetical protein PR048_022625 [Dryococelus australis]|uniref:Uncharacterized protein n=1 Tax=Dryococelus australis TaxID=614101 RepID=A0ABQ9H1H8_9NEOP|nr:hypothetical protein PR048_022625 [Dryococelus australis]